MKTATLCFCVTAIFLHQSIRAENASSPLGEPVLEHPTLYCLGAYWIIKGDDNKNAKVEMAYRKSGAQDWTKSLPMLRVEKGAAEGKMMDPGDAGRRKTLLSIPADAWLFAGSVVMLNSDTEYELKLSLVDPDGGSTERVLKCRTKTEPVAPANAVQRFVEPGSGGGSGTAGDPFKGLAAAQSAARPGDLFLLRPGIYDGEFDVTKSGEPGKPIIWRGAGGAGGGESIIQGTGINDAKPTVAIEANDVHDVWFERLSIRNASFGCVTHESARIVVRRCHFYNIAEGFTCMRNTKGQVADYFISDNIIEGSHYKWCFSSLPDGKENPAWKEQWKTEWRGIELTGTGHDICYNLVRNFKDTLDVWPSQHASAIDFHHNDCREAVDDGIEMDYSERNTRCFMNRFANIHQGISIQPVFGGPVYIFRNVMYNIAGEPFKFHNVPSGVMVFHNTAVKQGVPTFLYTGQSPHNCISRNNLFVGTAGNYAFESIPNMLDCDFDYDGFAVGPFAQFLKWNSVKYATLDDVKARAPVYKHAALLEAANLFQSDLKAPADPNIPIESGKVDLRLKDGSGAVDAGVALPGFNDGFKGKAPDLGAYELGSELPQYGPRPEK